MYFIVLEFQKYTRDAKMDTSLVLRLLSSEKNTMHLHILTHMGNIIVIRNTDCCSGYMKWTPAAVLLALSPRAFYHFVYCNRLEPRMTYSNWRAPSFLCVEVVKGKGLPT